MTDPASRASASAATPSRARHTLPWVFGALGCLLSVAAWYLLRSHENRAIETQFALEAGERQLLVQERFNDAMKALNSVWALYDTVAEVQSEQFAVFTRSVLDQHSYIQGVGWNPLVLDSERDAFEEKVRSAGDPDFQITDRAAQGKMVRAARRDYYVPVEFLEPYAGNEAALGFDTASEPTRRDALERARATREPAISSRITLVQERQRLFSVLVYTPVFNRSASGSSEWPSHEVAGFVVGVLRIGAVVESALAPFTPAAMDVVVVDESASEGEGTLYSTLDSGEDIAAPLLAGRPLLSSREMALGGRTWTVTIGATDAYLASLRSYQPLAGLTISLLLTILGTAYLINVTDRAAREEQRRAELEATTEVLRRAAERRDAAEAALHENEERLQLTLGAVADGAWDWNMTNDEVIFSDSWLASLGYDRADVEPHVSSWQSLVHPEDVPEVREALQRHLDGETPHYEVENRLREKSGEYRWNLDKGKVVSRDEDGRPLRMVGTDTDIGERKAAERRQRRAEQQVQQAQKLESLGVLAGGIAHDFNNILVAVLGGTDLALTEVPEKSPAREHLNLVKTAAGRAADLIRQIHAYSGDASFTLERVDLSELVRGVSQLLESSVSKKARLRFDFDEDLPAVEGDATQLRQVVMNLIVNASDALAGNAGEVRVSTTLEAVASGWTLRGYTGEKLDAGEYVRLEVADDGVGMPEEIQSKIFDPFFTTKKRGQGLGLATTLGIVRSHRGGIRLRSRVGEGTTVEVLLPSAEGAPGTEALKADSQERSWRAEGLALVVDDDAAVRRVAEKMLSLLGFEVITAVDGLDGVETFTARQDEIRVVLLDMSMPRMDGADAFREIRKIRPDARVLLSSGYTERDSATLLASDDRAGFVQKPYRLDELRAMLESVLNV